MPVSRQLMLESRDSQRIPRAELGSRRAPVASVASALALALTLVSAPAARALGLL